MSTEPTGAGSDEDVIIDHDVQEHPIGGLVNQDPNVIWSIVRSVWGVMEQHGYYIVIGAIITYFLYNKLLDYLEERAKSNGSGEGVRLAPEVAMQRHEAMMAARMRLQGEVDKAAEIEAEKQREKEEKSRREKIEDWENHQKGGGYKSKTKAAPVAAKTLKPETYNAMMGGSGSSGYRPARRNLGGGGGGG